MSFLVLYGVKRNIVGFTITVTVTVMGGLPSSTEENVLPHIFAKLFFLNLKGLEQAFIQTLKVYACIHVARYVCIHACAQIIWCRIRSNGVTETER
jgi:hypothetical protein